MYIYIYICVCVYICKYNVNMAVLRGQQRAAAEREGNNLSRERDFFIDNLLVRIHFII